RGEAPAHGIAQRCISAPLRSGERRDRLPSAAKPRQFGPPLDTIPGSGFSPSADPTDWGGSY
ncbi:MAG: hypothetical protein AAFV46_05965, partial [Cyanobacteria bacterium J06635_11]